MKLLLVDDQPLFLEGLEYLLSSRGFEVVGTARDGLQALERARALRPDVILMDIRMPRCDGIEATRLIKAELPEIRIVMLTVSSDDEDLFEAIRAGATGYLIKNLQAEEFFRSLDALAQGEAPLSKGLATRIVGEFARRPERERPAEAGGRREGDELTPRQREILAMVAAGMTYKEIGAKLYLSERTVKYHIGRMLEQLHLTNRAQVIAYAQRAGLIPSGRPG